MNCNETCIYCQPHGGNTNCKFFPERLSKVIWQPLEKISLVCSAFKDGLSLDWILGMEKDGE